MENDRNIGLGKLWDSSWKFTSIFCEFSKNKFVKKGKEEGCERTEMEDLRLKAREEKYQECKNAFFNTGLKWAAIMGAASIALTGGLQVYCTYFFPQK